MKEYSADLLRQKFLEFFKARGHRVVESDSLVPKDDPTVLFTPAGMNQFKREFLGYDSGFRRAATSQRCLRTGDLDKVGHTAGHHTFFEMLGNFSFGDYFKKEAIQWAWEFLTAELKINPEKLWVSVYDDDREAYGIWKDTVNVPEKKIVKLGDKENFWPSEAKEKGPNGPCGPCSEIFFDFGKDKGCGRPDCSPACGCARFVEIWNLVFTQFNRKDGGVLEPLPQKNIDTGMGLERLAAVMQGKKNNFETDLFQPLVKEIINYGLRTTDYGLIYAIADHIRAITFAIYDGVAPSNDGRGYVVRKIIRKAIHDAAMIGMNKPFLYTLVPVLAEIMQVSYPELSRRKEDIAQIILNEEKIFLSAINSSATLLKEKFSGLQGKDNPELAGKIAFQLYDTYGIPLELTKDWLKKNKLEFSQESFNRQLGEQKTRSQARSAMKGDVFDFKALHLDVKKTKFSGYRQDIVTGAKILKLLKGDSLAKKISQGDSATIILEQSTFYPESGGQVGDNGECIKGKNTFEVLDTQKSGPVILHIGKVKAGSFKSGDAVTAKINAERRMDIARNHTATHLLQAALRKVLGPHVQQQGSLVAAERLRFDFTHFKDISDEEIGRIEQFVNEAILQNLPVGKKEKTLAEAKKSGALAFFAEKYANKVRVVSVGEISRELCGGTHLHSTTEVGHFRILQEGSVSSGIRRIEAVTGRAALKIIQGQEEAIRELSALLAVPAQRLLPELEKKIARIKELEKQLNLKTLSTLQSNIDELVKDSVNINNIKFISKVISDVDISALRSAVDLARKKVNSSVIAFGSSAGGRASLVIGLSADLIGKGLDAAALIKQVAPLIGGSGGGRQDFAQAGGNKPENFPEAFAELRKLVK
ncbi:MAG: alanine--tRNA ligase [Candidatus Omnitrophota bacterium]|nr:alanine--tRNA ligase [Candidatus Omnitrophota bacterium]